VFLDSTFLLLIPALILSFWAQAKVSGAFERFSRVAASSRMTGAMVARRILDQAGLQDIEVERIGGTLSDHYDPRAKVLRLSPQVHDSNSVAALGVAAHEVGHAIQHDTGYAALGMRNLIWPVANIGSNAGPFMFIIGLFLRQGFLMDLGIVLFFAAVIFYMVTLPVEFNASSRAMELLETGGYITREEVGPTRAVLSAAAWTYVAAALMAVSQLARLLLMRGSRRDD